MSGFSDMGKHESILAFSSMGFDRAESRRKTMGFRWDETAGLAGS
jgi:hypothetical protein